MPKGPVGERSDHGVAAEKKVRFFRLGLLSAATYV